MSAPAPKPGFFSRPKVRLVIALVLVVMLFKTRGEDIDVLRADNERLQDTLKKAQKDENVQKAAVAAERDWRRKEVALRSRRLAGEFTRTVLDALVRTHVDHLYLDQVRMQTEPKVSLDLDGRPSEDRATGGMETAGGDHLFQQQVWPSVKVDGTVQKEYTPNPGTTLNAYSTRLKQEVAALKVAGRPVEVGSTSLDRNDKFSLTFRLLAGEGGEGKAE